MKKAKNQKRKSTVKKKETKNHMFASKEEYIDYAFGSDLILCQALKNCIED